MKAKWQRFDDWTQEWKVTDRIEGNVYVPSTYSYEENSKDWGWDVSLEICRGRAKTERLAKRAAKLELIKLFRELGKALDYDVE